MQFLLKLETLLTKRWEHLSSLAVAQVIFVTFLLDFCIIAGLDDAVLRMLGCIKLCIKFIFQYFNACQTSAGPNSGKGLKKKKKKSKCMSY